jgi:heat shock protein 90kDa beta
MLERVKEGNGELDDATAEYADLLFNMAILNSGFLVENPMDLTEPLEKLIKVGFGLSRDAAIEEIDVAIDDDEDEESGDDGEDIEEVDLDDDEEEMIDDL